MCLCPVQAQEAAELGLAQKKSKKGGGGEDMEEDGELGSAVGTNLKSRLAKANANGVAAAALKATGENVYDPLRFESECGVCTHKFPNLQ